MPETDSSILKTKLKKIDASGREMAARLEVTGGDICLPRYGERSRVPSV